MNDTVLDPALFAQIDADCDAGLYLRVAPHLPLLEASAGSRARMLAARVRSHLGARRLADARMLREGRARPDDLVVRVNYVRVLHNLYGPYRAWEAHAARTPQPGDEAWISAEWHGLHATLLGSFRDFSRAHAALDRAMVLAPREAWHHVERAHLLEMDDRYTEARAAAERALELLPDYRPAVQALAHELVLLGDDNAACALLEAHCARAQSAWLTMQYIDLLIEREEFDAAWAQLERCEALMPQADKSMKKWLAAQRADVAARLGKLDLARANAALAGGTFHEALAARIAEGTHGTRRVQLDVGFVRQHHYTCAPATLTALTHYWGREAEHLDVAEAICYDGTSHYSERNWAERQGFSVREFTVDWQVATALIDAGVPFTLTTVWTGGGHLQAVIGYDELRRTLLIRDPFKRTYNEFPIDELLETHRAVGPRGLALLPASEEYRVASIHFPERPERDAAYALTGALEVHDREAARGIAEDIARRFPGQRVAHEAARALACYDGDEARILASTEALLALYPDDINLQLSKTGSLSQIAPRAALLEWSEQLAQADKPDAMALARHADLLAVDTREVGRAAQLARRALRMAPGSPAAWQTYAGILWQRGTRDAALAHYRYAACLGETRDHYAASYFRATHWLRRTEEGLAFLRERVARWGARSAAPMVTLFEQLESLERTDEAFTALDDALVRHPDDAELVLFAAEARLRYTQVDRARALLDACRAPAKRARWLVIAARMARDAGDLAGAQAQAREAAQLEPLNLGAHRLVAQLIDRAEGRQPALAYLRELAARFDHHFGVQQMLLGWLDGEPLPEADAVLRHLVALNPVSSWAQRELAINLARQLRCEDARAVMQKVLEFAADESATHSTLGFIELREGRTEDAHAHLRRAVELSIDNDYALGTLIESGRTLKAREAAVAFVRAELVRQVTTGDSLLAFQDAAQRALAAQDVLAVMREAHAERPDLWQAWVALGSQLADMGEPEEALQLYAEAEDKFPMLPRLYFEQGRALVLADRREDARAAFRRALELTPNYSAAVRAFVDTVVDEGVDYPRALDVLERALTFSPDDAQLRANRGLVLYYAGRRDEARADIERALTLDARIDWPWTLLARIGRESGDAAAAHDTAQRLTETRPGEMIAWLRLAEHAQNLDEALAAARRAVELEPRSTVANQALLDILFDAGRYDDVLAALANHAWPKAPPPALRVFAARVEHARDHADKARGKLRALLAEDPNDYAIWRLLAEWSNEAGDNAAYIEAGENMVRIAPNFAKAHGYLAHALERANDAALKPRARRHLERALEIDPAYSFAGYTLFDWALEDKAPDEARAVLETLRPHVGTDRYFITREMQLAGACEDQARAAELLPELLAPDADGNWPVDTALAVCAERGWLAQLDAATEAAAAAGRCHAAAAKAWIKRRAGEGDQALAGAKLFAAIAAPLRADPAFVLRRAVLSFCGETRDGSLVEAVVREHREALATDIESYGLVGYATVATDRFKDTASWMSDWREREHLPAWALDNLALALRVLKRDREAREVSQRSLELEPHNQDAHTWMAVDAARAGDLAQLAQSLAQIDAGKLAPYFLKLQTVAHAYLHSARSGDASLARSRFAEYKEARKSSVVLDALIEQLTARLLRHHTPLLLRPWRWLQFQLG